MQDAKGASPAFGGQGGEKVPSREAYACYSEVSPIIVNRTYSQVSVFRIASRV